MIVFMAQTASEKPGRGIFKCFAFAVFGAHGHLGRTARQAVFSGHGQAPLNILLGSFGTDDLGIDEFDDLVAILLQPRVDNIDTAQNADLHGG